MSFQLLFTQEALNGIEKHKKSGDKSVLNKLKKIIDELEVHPKVGLGKPEQLKHQFSGYWSRRLNQKHRLVYSIGKSDVQIISVFGHY